MGVHCTIIVDQNLPDTRLETVTETFRPLDDVFTEIARDDAGENPTPNISLKPWEDLSRPGDKESWIFGAPAGGMCFTFGAHVLSVHTGTKFFMFATIEHEREMIRRFSFRLASLLGNDRVIYTACEGLGDHLRDCIYDGYSLTEIEEKLADGGLPAPSIEALYSEGIGWQRHYFIDRFDDFRNRSI
ncbi:MAG: hypothetical protein MI923_01995 [Phycisphaerales bacterium]|nr:hypothetical protein [Phycisphaerales bacterium]